jgi:hypothetical protein
MAELTGKRIAFLPAFCAKIAEEFAEGRHEGQRAAPAGARA